MVAARSLARMRAIGHAVGEPRIRWTVGLYDTFDATMAGRLDDAETIATANLDLGLQIGVPDAFTFFAGQLFVIASFGGRHDELLPIVEQAANDTPGVVPFKLAYGIICAAVGRDEVARDILSEGVSTRFSEISVDNIWMTSVIGYAVLAIDLGDAEAAAHLLPLIEPFATEVVVQRRDEPGPDRRIRGQARVAARRARGRRAALARGARDRNGVRLEVPPCHHVVRARARRVIARRARSTSNADGWLGEASELCRAGGFRSWIPQIDALRRPQPSVRTRNVSGRTPSLRPSLRRARRSDGLSEEPPCSEPPRSSRRGSTAPSRRRCGR